MRELDVLAASGFIISTRPKVHKMGLSFGRNSCRHTGEQEWTREDGLMYGGTVWEPEGIRGFVIVPRKYTGPKAIK